MTAYSKTYAAEIWDLATVAALLLALLTHYATDTATGLVVLAGFVAVCWRAGMTLTRWAADRDIIRRERAASMARHPSARATKETDR